MKTFLLDVFDDIRDIFDNFESVIGILLLLGGCMLMGIGFSIMLFGGN